MTDGGYLCDSVVERLHSVIPEPQRGDGSAGHHVKLQGRKKLIAGRFLKHRGTEFTEEWDGRFGSGHGGRFSVPSVPLCFNRLPRIGPSLPAPLHFVSQGRGEPERCGSVPNDQ